MKGTEAKRQMVLSTLVLGALILLALMLVGATITGLFTFIQDSWAGGASVNDASHTLHQIGWTEYASKDAGVSAGANLSLLLTSDAVTHTSDGDFNSGNASNVTVSGDNVTLSLSSLTYTWELMSPSGGPPVPRSFSTFVWDSNNERIYLYAGLNAASSFVNNLWSYTPSTNAWAALASGPTSYYGRAAAWDPLNEMMYVMGGCHNNGAVNGVHGYNASSNSWLALSTGPGARCAHEAAWNPVNQTMVLFGGDNGNWGIEYNDLWSYDPATGSWSQWIPNAAVGSPADRRYSRVAWDTNNDIMYLFGGNQIAGGSGVRNDLWSYDPATNAWTQLLADGAAGSPPRRERHTLVWDPVLERLYLFGGVTATYVGDLWSYDPATGNWTQISATGGPPVARGTHAAIWDPVADVMWMYGGDSSGGKLSDLWSLTASTPYASSGNLTSALIDLGQPSAFTTLNWTESLPNNTDIRFRLRSGNSSDLSGATWYGPTNASDYYGSSGTDINAVHAGNRYVQYRAFLNTSDASAAPTLSDVTIGYTHYPNESTLTSTPYDTANPLNVIDNVSWEETLAANTSIVLQLRSALDSSGAAGNWSVWMGPDGTNSTYFTNRGGGDAIPASLSDGADDQWLQYRVFLRSTDGVNTPTLTSVSINYSSLDSTAPSVTVSAPTAGATVTAATPTLTFTATDDYAAAVNYVVYVDGGATADGDGSAANGTAESASLASLADGSHTVVVQVSDASGNAQNSSSVDFTVSTATAAASSGAPAAKPEPYVERESQVWSTLAAGEEARLVITDESIAVEHVSATPSEQTTSAQIRVEKVEREHVPSAPSTAPYQYLRLTKYSLPDDKLARPIEIGFHVELDWLDGKRLDSVRLLRLTDGWDALPTRHVRTENGRAHFVSETPGFSYFAIVADEQREIVAPAPEPEPAAPEEPQVEEPRPVIPSGPVETPADGSPWWIFALVLIPAVAAVISIERRHRTKR